MVLCLSSEVDNLFPVIICKFYLQQNMTKKVQPKISHRFNVLVFISLLFGTRPVIITDNVHKHHSVIKHAVSDDSAQITTIT